MLLPIELTAFDHDQKFFVFPEKICYFFLTKGPNHATTLVIEGASPIYVNETPKEILEKICTMLILGSGS